MKYKVLITDYDGTFIKNDKTVSLSQLKSVKDFILSFKIDLMTSL